MLGQILVTPNEICGLLVDGKFTFFLQAHFFFFLDDVIS